MTLNNLGLSKHSRRRDLLIVILCFLIAAVSSDIRYEGCFSDNSNRVLDGPSAYRTDLTTEMCIHLCRNHDFKYAGVEYSTMCFCGNTLPPVSIDEKVCNATCAGNATEMCGGTWAIGVYDTRDYLSPQTQTRRNGMVKIVVGATISGVIALCVAIYLASSKKNTPKNYPDDRNLKNVYRPSKIAWLIVISLLVLSLATIIAAASANTVVLRIRSLGQFEKIKGGIIAIVATILHVLIGDVVMKKCAFIAVWVLMIYPRQVRFSLLYNAIAGIGWDRITYCLRNKERLVLVIWIAFGTGSIIASLVTGLIFKDTVCTEVASVNTPVASFWRQIAGGGNNSVITGYQAAIMAMGSIANKLDSPGIIYDRNTSGFIALRPLQYPETFRNVSIVKGLEAVLTTTSCKLGVVTQNSTLPYTFPNGNQILLVNYDEQAFDLTIDNGGPERFKWINMGTSQSSGKIHHAATRTVSVINDDDYPRYLLVGELQRDLGVNLTVNIPPNSIFNITVHLVISTCDVVSHPINVTMTGDLLTLVDTTEGNGVDNWWSIVNTTGIRLGLEYAYLNMRPRSGAGALSPGLLEDISLNYSFTGMQCNGILECVEQLHSKTFSSILQNTAIPLVYDLQTYQIETQKTCPISIDINTLLLTFGIMGMCYSTLALAEHFIRLTRKTCRPTTSILELCKRSSEFIMMSTEGGQGVAGEMELLETVGNKNISANFKTTDLQNAIHFSFDTNDRSIRSSDLTGDEHVM